MLAGYQHVSVALLAILLLTGCQTVYVPPSQVNFQGETTKEVISPPIEINNCDGKAPITRTEKFEVSVETSISEEIAGAVGVSAEVVSAEVQRIVGVSLASVMGRGTEIKLEAPPQTRMVIELIWVGSERLGVVQNYQGTGIPLVFRTFAPEDVRIRTQIDLGCQSLVQTDPGPVVPDSGPLIPDSSSVTTNGNSVDSAPTQVLPSITPVQILSSNGVPPYGETTLTVQVIEGTIHVFTSGPICVAGTGYCLVGGEGKGSVTVLLPRAEPYLLTNLVPTQNWHGAYQASIDQWQSLANGAAAGMKSKSPDNVNCGRGCDSVDVLVVGTEGVVTLYNQ